MGYLSEVNTARMPVDRDQYKIQYHMEVETRPPIKNTTLLPFILQQKF